MVKQTPIPNRCPKTLPLKNPNRGNNSMQSNIDIEVLNSILKHEELIPILS